MHSAIFKHFNSLKDFEDLFSVSNWPFSQVLDQPVKGQSLGVKAESHAALFSGFIKKV